MGKDQLLLIPPCYLSSLPLLVIHQFKFLLLSSTMLRRNYTNNIFQDALHPLPGPRFSQIIESFHPISTQTPPSPNRSPSHSLSDLVRNLTHFSTPTLAHLIALLCHRTSSFPLQNTSLIVIDSLSALISSAFPRRFDSVSPPKKAGSTYLLVLIAIRVYRLAPLPNFFFRF